MKIDKIERLNANRTQGEWTNILCTKDDAFFKISPHILMGDKGYIQEAAGHTIHDTLFIVETPRMAEMLIKLRDFKVDEEFTRKMNNNPLLDKKGVSTTQLCQAVIAQLIEELEKE